MSFSSHRVTLPAFVNVQAVRLTDYGRNYAARPVSQTRTRRVARRSEYQFAGEVVVIDSDMVKSSF